MTKPSEIQFLVEQMNKFLSENAAPSLREKLAELEHDQWCEWSKDIAKKEDLSRERLTRWMSLWKPYVELSEEEKDQDRIYADKVIRALKSSKNLNEGEVVSFPLPKNHWLYAEHDNVYPESDPEKKLSREAVVAAAKYAIRASTYNGKDLDFDPDAMVQNFLCAMHNKKSS